ncbi:hypothetical protein RP20_CCG002246 [Aedes albopictus]|nr:hypothetical protein RP20_CCG002246 [Aedes albopictus]
MESNESNSKCVWSKDAVMALITSWSSKEHLYNTKHDLYKNKHARQHALSEICESLQAIMPGINIDDVKNKINNLRSQYSRELTKHRTSARSGTGTDEMYESSAYWYPHMTFLKDFVSTRKGKSNLDDLEYLQSDPDDGNSSEVVNEGSNTETESDAKQAPKRKRGSDDTMLNQAAAALQSIAEVLNTEKENLMDDVHTFGEHIKAELYALHPKEREELKFQINKLIYEFKMART